MTNEELLSRAKKDYPVGTIFVSAQSGATFTVSDFAIHKIFEGSIIVDQKGERPKLYYQNQWSKIISKPEVKLSKDKPQFEVGKWYKNLGSTKEYIGKFEKMYGTSTIWLSEYIWNKKHNEDSGSLAFSSDTVEVSVSEIQQYLPSDHEDKLPVKQDTMKELTELPEKWCIEVTEKNKDVLRSNSWSSIYYVNNIVGRYVCSDNFQFKYHFAETYGTEITLDQFKRWVLKESVSDTLKVEDLVEGEIYSCDYSTIKGYIFIYSGKESWYINPKSDMYSKSSWDFWRDSKNLKKATDEEKKWLEKCISAGKFISLEDSKVTEPVAEQ